MKILRIFAYMLLCSGVMFFIATGVCVRYRQATTGEFYFSDNEERFIGFCCLPFMVVGIASIAILAGMEDLKKKKEDKS